MGDLHSTKCIIYANLYILNMKRYIPIILSDLQVVWQEKTIKTLHHLFGYFHISCYLDELPLSV